MLRFFLSSQGASAPASSHETTTKILGEFADLGLISLGRGTITVHDQDMLRQLGGY